MTTHERTPLLEAIRDAEDAAKKSQSSAAPTNISRAKLVTILGATWISVFLGALDTTIVATLVSPISSSFHSSNQVSWLGTSYLLAIATTTPLYGRLSDITGRRVASLIALTFFTVGTLMCGLSNSMNMLIASRALAGMGGGGIMTISSIVASDLIPLKKRGLVQGLVNILYGAGSGLGAPLGGYIASKYDWRWAFLVQVPPLCLTWILIFVFVRYQLPSQLPMTKEAFKRVDWLGSATLICCISGLLLSLSFKNNENLPWSDARVWATLTAFVVFLAIFIYVEAKISPFPVMPLRILSHRSPICIAFGNFLLSMISFIVLYYLPLFFETVQLQSPKEAGLHLVPCSIALSAGSLFAGIIMRSTGKYYYLIISFGLSTLISVAMFLRMSDTVSWVDWVAVVPTAFGTGGMVTALLIALLANVDREDVAVATGISYLFRYCGQVVGVGVAGAILQGVLTSQLRQRITGPGSEELIRKIRTEATSIIYLPKDLRLKAVQSYAMGLRYVFLLVGALSIINTILAFSIEEYPLPGSFEEEQKFRESRRLQADSNVPSGAATPR